MSELLSITESIKKDISENDIVLYMKGTPEKPLCGFSQTVVKILKELNAPFKGINILDNPDLRQGIKDFSNWPTVPQLYIKGEFIGGCDIAQDMYQKGELEFLLNSSR